MQHVRGDTLVNATLASTASTVLCLDAIDLLSLQAIYANATTVAKVFASSTDIAFATDIFTKTAHGQATGSVGQFTTSSALPTGLSTSTNYYVIVVDANHIKFASSLANAVAGTAVNITDNGTGNQTFTPTTSAGNVLKLQNTNDPLTAAGVNSNWIDISGDTITIATSAGTALWDLGKPTYRWVNILYTPAAGQIALQVILNGKADR